MHSFYIESVSILGNVATSPFFEIIRDGSNGPPAKLN